MFYLIAVPLALLPSFLWLLFYLRKDVHPEPNHLVIKVFLWSMIVTIAAAAVLFGIAELRESSVGIQLELLFPSLFFLPIFLIFFNAFWEESLKYFIVRFSILRNPEFDEPVDAMEYMIISALGFAAVENILISAKYIDLGSLTGILFARFLGATFIHVLSSAILGFFLARAIFWKGSRRRYPLKPVFILGGLLIASGLHGIFNFLIIRSEDLSRGVYLYLLVVFLMFLAVVVTWGFRRLNLQSLKRK